MIPGPAPVTTIQSRAATFAARSRACSYSGSSGRVRAEPKIASLRADAVRREHVERVAHLLQRRVRELQVTAVGVVGGEAHRRRDQLEHEVGIRRVGGAVDDRRDLGVERGITRAVAGELHDGQAPSSGWASSRSDCSGRAPRWLMTSAAANAPSCPRCRGRSRG